jgi:hypothetical protein
MKSCLAKLAIATVGMAAVFAPAAGAAPLSKTVSFTNQSRKVMCGIEIHAPNRRATNVLCSASGIPRPRNFGPVGDPFVQISVLGRPKIVPISQQSFVSGRTSRLGRGRLWNQLGVTCHVAKATVMCFNGDNHGFVIGNGRYRSF